MAQLFHVGLTVKNLERSLAFYRDVAGMTVGQRMEARSKEFDTLTNNPGAPLKAAHLTPVISCSSFSNTQRGAVTFSICIIITSAALTCRSMCRMSKQS